jgi:ubiquinone/menaquinone biosynthesis C-methylase UbiE
MNIQPSDHVLEIGFGPGLALERIAHLTPTGRVVGIDHSALMVDQAGRRNRTGIEAGLVELRRGDLEMLSTLGETFDKVVSVNVLQFLPDRTRALRQTRSGLKPGGLIATTVQPRHRGATAEDAAAFGRQLSKELTDAGFYDVSVKKLELGRVPAVCVLACKG